MKAEVEPVKQSDPALGNNVEPSVPRDTKSNWFPFFAFASIAILAAWLYREALTIGFLLDDFFHLDYLLKAFGGQPERLYQLLWSNWSADTTMTSYRPLVSFSLAADFALWHINAFGYHLTNVLMFSGCAVLTGCIALELSKVFSVPNSRLIAVTSAALFAVYPLHPEAVAWIIGRVDLLCTLFYLSSMYLYLVHRRTQSTWVLIGTLGAFLLALMSKEMAVTLPVVLTVFELLAANAGEVEPRPSSTKVRFGIAANAGEVEPRPYSAKVRFGIVSLPRALVWMWGVLLGFAVYRTLVLGTVIGGYGNSGWKTIKQGFKNFLDNATLLKVLFGASEEFVVPGWVRNLAFGSLAVISVNAVVSSIRSKVWTPLAFLALWTVISILPTFQIWHIWPNLVGSRLFFLGSAPFCLLIAFAAFGYGNRIFSLAAMLLLCGSWSIALDSNLKAWYGARDRFNEFRSQLSSFYPKLHSEQKLLIPALPQDYKGGPILGRPEYLATLTRPPFADQDYSGRILTLEPIIAGGAEYIGPAAYRRALSESKYSLNWKDHESDALRSRLSEPANQSPEIQITPAVPLSLKQRENWLHSSPEHQVISYDATAIRGAKFVKLYIGKSWFPITNAPRPVPPDSQSIELETEFLPISGSFEIPSGIARGAHDVAILAFGEDRKPLGLLSETVSFIAPGAE